MNPEAFQCPQVLLCDNALPKFPTCTIIMNVLNSLKQLEHRFLKWLLHGVRDGQAPVAVQQIEDEVAVAKAWRRDFP